MLYLLDELLRNILMDGVNRLQTVPEKMPGRTPPNPPVPPTPPLTETQIGFGLQDEEFIRVVRFQTDANNKFMYYRRNEHA